MITGKTKGGIKKEKTMLNACENPNCECENCECENCGCGE